MTVVTPVPSYTEQPRRTKGGAPQKHSIPTPEPLCIMPEILAKTECKYVLRLDSMRAHCIDG
jgi:hypothetical protein